MQDTMPKWTQACVRPLRRSEEGSRAWLPPQEKVKVRGGPAVRHSEWITAGPDRFVPGDAGTSNWAFAAVHLRQPRSGVDKFADLLLCLCVFGSVSFRLGVVGS